MIDAARVRRMLASEGLGPWSERIEGQLGTVLEIDPHGDWVRWKQALDALPDLGPGTLEVCDGAVALRPAAPIEPMVREEIEYALRMLHPWRKGPFRVADLLIDAEWRSDWKWDRVRPHLDSLDGRLVLDVGCGNGYYAWRMALEGARRVIGVDPTALFLAQFLAIRRLGTTMGASPGASLDVLPLGIEQVPGGLQRFDTVFSMGVLYHRRSPIDHLAALRGSLRRGGQLVLETLVIDGDDDSVLVPEGRYAKMRNVWFIPTTRHLHTWLMRSGFSGPVTVDITRTGLEEQRSTDWMRFESLADFLDPADRQFTVEGYPAPHRAIVVASAA